MYYCAFSGSFGEYACNPRTLGSRHLNRMVSLEGIVTKCSLVRPKVVQSVHWNEKEQSFLVRKYQDQTMSANGPASLSVYPQEDEKHNPVRLLLAGSVVIADCLSSSRSMATAPTETIKRYLFKRCQSELRPANSPVVLT